jgi:hypothetical protein
MGADERFHRKVIAPVEPGLRHSQTDLRQFETDFTTSPIQMRRMPNRQPNSPKRPSVCKCHSTNLVKGMKETRYAGGQGFSGAYEAGLEMKKAESGL